MTDSFLHLRLARLGVLDALGRDALEPLLARQVSLGKGELLVCQGAAQEHTYFALTGWGMRYKTLADGARQIVNFVLPGDVICLFAHLFRTSDHSISALEPMNLACLPAARLPELFKELPRLAYALAWMGGQDERILAEQIVRVGRLTARQRLAHLLVELHLRLCRAGFDPAAALRFPLTQTQLADALGMSTVHANRTVSALARASLVAREHGHVEILDVGALAALAGFEADYLEGGSSRLGPSTRSQADGEFAAGRQTERTAPGSPPPPLEEG